MFGQIKMEIPWYIIRHTLISRKRDGKPRMIGGQFVVVRLDVSHMLYANDLTLLTNEPRDMQIMLSRLAVYARNKHLIVNTSKLCTSTPRVKMFLFLMLAVPPFITKNLLGIWAWFFKGP